MKGQAVIKILFFSLFYFGWMSDKLAAQVHKVGEVLHPPVVAEAPAEDLQDTENEVCYDLMMNLLGYNLEAAAIGCEPNGEPHLAIQQVGERVRQCGQKPIISDVARCLIAQMDACGNVTVEPTPKEADSAKPVVCECNLHLAKIVSLVDKEDIPRDLSPCLAPIR